MIHNMSSFSMSSLKSFVYSHTRKYLKAYAEIFLLIRSVGSNLEKSDTKYLSSSNPRDLLRGFQRPV